MSKSIRVSDELFSRAQSVARNEHRSATQQIEHWAKLGIQFETMFPRLLTNVKWGNRTDMQNLIDFASSPEGKSTFRSVVNSIDPS